MIQLANTKDLKSVLDWLRRSYAKTGDGFWCNRRLIRGWFRDNKMYVCLVNQQVVGFIAGEFGRDSVMEIRPRYRKRGYGRLIAEDWIQRAQKAGICVLEIQCSPSTSIPFWSSMGFAPTKGSCVPHEYYRVFETLLPLPACGEDCDISIEIFEEERCWNSELEPIVISHMKGKLSSGIVHLPKRFLCYSPSQIRGTPILRIRVNCTVRFFGFASRKQISDVGLAFAACRTPYFDRLHDCQPFSEFD
ncbi:MAG: GNAT family N-acetyltransferase [Hyphomicrobium sp.]